MRSSSVTYQNFLVSLGARKYTPSTNALRRINHFRWHFVQVNPNNTVSAIKQTFRL